LLLFGALFVAITLAGAVLQSAAPWLGSGLGVQMVFLLVAGVIASWVMMRWVERRPFGALGYAITPRTPRELLIGFAIGGGGLAVGVVVLVLGGMLSYRPETGDALGYVSALLLPVVTFGIAAAAEETLFRGYPFQVLVRGIGALPATVLASTGFALAHRNNPGVGTFALVNIFLAGILLSFAYLRTRSLWFATAVHLGWNWTMATLFDLPVSGLRLVDTPLYDASVRGPLWFTGGDFGPEGGVVATGAFVLMMLAVWRMPGLGEPGELRRLRPLVDDTFEEAA
jgi:membrane protease YdiL (CAAX protease family)